MLPQNANLLRGCRCCTARRSTISCSPCAPPEVSDPICRARRLAAVLTEAGALAERVLLPLDAVGDAHGLQLGGGPRDDGAGLAGGLCGVERGRLGGCLGSGGSRRHGTPLPARGRGDGTVEQRQRFLRARPGAERGRHRGDRPARRRGAARTVSPQTGRRHLDRYDEPHGAAGGLGRGRAPHPRRAAGGRHLPHPRQQDLHHLRRARPHGEHRASRPRPSARRPARSSRDLAVPGPEVPPGRGRQARPAQRRPVQRPRTQARHACRADLHHELRRRRRRDGLAGRRTQSRAELHVHDDEQRPPCRGHPGRRRGRTRDAGGDRLSPAPACRAAAPHRPTPRARSFTIRTSLACC